MPQKASVNANGVMFKEWPRSGQIYIEQPSINGTTPKESNNLA
jgi:hypothetical protein